ncbi:MAG: hypothetical protein WCK49_00900 [Myxococcaceae bacterium]
MRFFQIFLWLVYAAASLAQTPVKKDWALSASMGNSVGIGTFVTGYSQTPAWSTSLIFTPSYKIPEFWGLPRISLSAYQLISVWWLDSYVTTPTNAQNRVVFSDLMMSGIMNKILNFESSGFSLGAGPGLWAPVSSFSRNMNRILGFTFAAPIAWNKWGFSAGFTPSILAWTHSDTNISVPCLEMPTAAINPYDQGTNMDQAIQGLSIIKNGDERLGDGRCLVSGRQNIWTLNNSFSLGWSNPNHAVNLGLAWYVNFLRPLADQPELRSPYAINQNFNEVTMGRVAYSYTVPIETNLTFSAGILSWQSAYDQAGHLTFPFFDFVTPGNNQTQIFVQATVGI